MVLENFAMHYMKKYLEEYVSNFDSSTFNLGIWGGDAVLENLELKQTALDDLNLPVKCSYGRLAKIFLKIPWRNLYTEPTIIHIEGVYLLVVPNQHAKYDATKEARWAKDEKNKTLDRVEYAKKLEMEKDKPKAETSSLMESVLMNVIKNLQVTIKNIHIRFEDRMSNPGKPFAVGVTLDSLVTKTIAHWGEKLTIDPKNLVFKELTIKNLSVYWNNKESLFSTKDGLNISKALHETLPTDENVPKHKYILGPISLLSNLRMNAKPDTDGTNYAVPQFLLSCELVGLLIRLSRNQYEDIMAFLDSLDMMAKAGRFRKYRPLVSSYKGHYREWWHFAYNCILEDVRRRSNDWDWNHIKTHRDAVHKYAAAYYQKLITQKPSQELKDKLDSLEDQLDTFNIVLIREKMLMEAQRDPRYEAATKPSGWFSGWFGGRPTVEDSSDFRVHLAAELTPEEKEKMFRAIGYREGEIPQYPAHFVYLDLGISLQGLNLEVINEDLKDPLVLLVALHEVNTRIRQRPAASAIMLESSIQRFTVVGVKQGAVIPKLVTTQTVKTDSTEKIPLLKIMFETNPMDKQVDQRVHFYSQPIHIIYDAVTINSLVQVFTVEQPPVVQQIQAAAQMKLAEFKELSALGVQHMIELHTTLEVHVDMLASVVLMPRNGFYEEGCAALVVSLGNVKVITMPRKYEAIKEIASKLKYDQDLRTEILSQSYDRFQVLLTDLQVVYSKAGEDWSKAENNPLMYFLKPTDLQLDISNCIIPADPRLPKMKLNGQLSSVHFTLAETRLKECFALLLSVPFPESAPPPPAPEDSDKALNLIPELTPSSTIAFSTTRLAQPSIIPQTGNTRTSKKSEDQVVQFNELEAYFELKEVAITIVNDKNGTPVELLEFRLFLLDASVSQLTFMMSVDMRLGGIILKHNYNNDWLHVIKTPMAEGQKEYLFIVKYVNVEKKSPEFHSKYGSVLQGIEADFTKVTVLLHCEALIELITWAEEFQKIFESQQENKIVTAPETTRRRSTGPLALPSKSKYGALGTPGPGEGRRMAAGKSRVDPRVEEVQMKFRAGLGEISLSLWKAGAPVTQFGIQGGTGLVVMKTSYMTADVKLEGIVLENNRPHTYYTNILSLVDQNEVFKLKAIMFNDPGKAPGKVDMSFQVRMACVRIVFLNNYVMSVLDFLNQFSTAQAAIIDASTAAAEAAKQNVQSAYVNATRVALDVYLVAPLIVVPVNDRSYEALMLNMGNLTAKNSFLDVAVPSATDPAVLDRLHLDLKNLKLSRVLLAEDMSITKEQLLIKPISFKLTVQRNLSSGWFVEVPDLEVSGKLQTIHISLSTTDYHLVMKILDKNLGDRGPVAEEPVAPPSVLEKKSSGHYLTKPDLEGMTLSKLHLITTEQKESVRTTMKFALTLESLVLELMAQSLSTDSEDVFGVVREGLARVTLDVISVKGSMMSDESLHTALVLLDCIVDDTRPAKHSKINRYMERKKEPAEEDIGRPRSMIDITYQQKKDATFADIRICSFILILNVEHLGKISQFFSAPPDEDRRTSDQSEKAELAASTPLQDRKSSARPTVSGGRVSSVATPSNIPASKMTFNFKCEHPDVILVENLDDIDTSALVLNMETTFSYRSSETKTLVSGSICGLQLFSCSYNPEKRNATKAPVLRPVTVSLAGSSERVGGMKMAVDSTEIRISVSPGTITLLSSVSAAMAAGAQSLTRVAIAESDLKDLWKVEKFQEFNYPFLKTELAQEADDMAYTTETTGAELTDTCILRVPQIIFTLESGTGTTTLPLLYLEASLNLLARNWSTNLSMECKLMMEVSYYNNKLALWEPLLEPLETYQDNTPVYVPWALTVVMESNPPDKQAIQKGANELFCPSKPVVYYGINSSEMLNLTLTKISLEVMTGMASLFTEAIYQPVEYTGEKSPYVVKNDSGVGIVVYLKKNQDFRVFSPFQKEETAIEEVVLDSGALVELSTELEQTHGLKSTIKEKFIHIRVPVYDCEIFLPVSRADKRFFLLNHRGPGNDQWGIVSEVNVKNGQTIVTLRGMIQIRNFFNEPVNVYSMMNKENELHLVGAVEPNGRLNLPLEAIYTQTNELFFSVEGYTVSIVPFVWKDLQKSLQKSMVLRCNPRNTEDSEPLFLKAVGEMEQVFFENTKRHTMLSTCYNISIRPTVLFKNFLPVNVIACIQGVLCEKLLSPGDVIHIPTAEPGSSSLVIRIPEYLEREWSCKHELDEEPPEFAAWTFDCFETENKTTLELGMHVLTETGTHSYKLYCPFWMLNKTGLRLAYKSDDAGTVLHHPDDYEGVIMFSFRGKAFFAKKKSSIRVEDGAWSDKFSLDVAGDSGVIICKSKNTVYHIGVQIRITSNPLTKEVLFTPFYVIVNNFPFRIDVKEVTTSEEEHWIEIDTGSCVPFWPTQKADQSRLVLRVATTSETTIPFHYHKVHTTLLKLDNKFGAVNVDIQITNGGVYISIHPFERGMAPALIINHTDVPMNIFDKTGDGKGKDKEAAGITLQPREQVLFTWESSEGDHLLGFADGKQTTTLLEDAIGKITIDKKVYYWSSFLHGLQRVLLFTDSQAIAADSLSLGENEQITQEVEVNIRGVGLSLVDNASKSEIIYISFSSSEVTWESRKDGKKRFKKLTSKDSKSIEEAYARYVQTLALGLTAEPIVALDNKMQVDFQNLKILSPREKEIRRSYSTGLWMKMCSSVHMKRIHVKLNRLQIDNQMYDCIFPVTFAPVPPPKSVSEQVVKPFIEVSIVKRINDYTVVQQYKYFKVLVQEFQIKVDIGLINAIANFFQDNVMSEETEVTGLLLDVKRISEPLYFFVSMTSLQEQKNFYDYLHFSPLKIHVSFSLTTTGSKSDKSEEHKSPPILALLMQTFGVTLTSIQDVVFRINYFERQHVFLSTTQLKNEAIAQYTSQGLKQFYVLVLGLDVIGNPLGLFMGITEGATALFYEPFQGAIQGPGEFAEGLVLGVRALVGHTVGGAAGAVSKITGAMGKGLAALTFDDDFQRQRRENQRNKPANMQEGLARSGKGLIMGVVEGVGGVVTKPLSGAREDGVHGFLKGFGKGMVGLITRPTTGFIDFASGSLGAVKRATEISDEVTRARTPRYIKPDGYVKPYSKREAEGNKFLQELEKGKYSSTDIYVFHMEIGYAPKFKDVLLLTDKRVVYLAYNEIFGGYQLEWTHQWEEITKGPEVVDEGIRFFLKKNTTIKSLFSNTEAGKVLLIDTPSMKTYVVRLMEEQMGLGIVKPSTSGTLNRGTNRKPSVN